MRTMYGDLSGLGACTDMREGADSFEPGYRSVRVLRPLQRRMSRKGYDAVSTFFVGNKELSRSPCTRSVWKGMMDMQEQTAKILGIDLKNKIRKILGQSLHIRHVDVGSCNGCDWEMVALNNPIYDLQRFGIDFVASPRHADMLLVTGVVTRNLETALRKTYAATPEPKLVVAVGACACGGGVFQNAYNVVGTAAEIIPVDVYIPGCPPRPEALLHGLMTAVDKWPSKHK
jgi:Ni,Fe-hydrogenase III small subunit